MKFISVLITVCLMCSVSFAESYLLIDKATDQILSISSRNDAVVHEDEREVVIDTDFRDIKLQYAPKYYQWKSGRFRLDGDMLSDDVNEALSLEERDAELNIIKQKQRATTITELKADGINIKHWNDDGTSKK